MGELVVVAELEEVGPARQEVWRQPSQAADDDDLIGLWLHNRTPHTLKAYTAEVRAFRAFLDGRPFRATRLGDLHHYMDSLGHLAVSSQCTKMAAIKSLFGFAFKIGYLQYNPAAAVRLRAPREALSERILSEADTHRLLAVPNSPRNQALLGLAYAGGLRISELVGLRWSNLLSRDETGQCVVHGKGNKTRVVLLPASIWVLLQGLRGDAGPDDAVFRSRKGGRAMDSSSAHRVIKAAALRAGLPPQTSMHVLRHCHASHSLTRGAPLSLVMATLGHASASTTSRYLHVMPGSSSGLFLGL